MNCLFNSLRKRYLLLSVFSVFLISSCVKDRYEKMEKYQRPDWLEGKIYTQISSQDNMQMFAALLVDTDYDKIINKTGTYAAFVPNDSALNDYLNNKYGTTDLGDIPEDDKLTLVKYHILQMPWSKEQLQSLNSRGWINVDDISNSEPTAFKRYTLYKAENRKYRIKRFLSGTENYEVITPDGNEDRIVYNDTYKQVPIYFDGFLDALELTGQDYSFYFNGRTYDRGEIYYANAKIQGDELFAENGFVYEIDDVVEVLPTAEEILESGDYSEYLELIYRYPTFIENDPATLAQEGADEGLEVDQLYDLSYSLPMDIHNERVGSKSRTLESNYGIMAPTNQAMDNFFNKYLSKWGNSWEQVPSLLQLFVIGSHTGQSAIYETNLQEGFYNELGDIVKIQDQSVIVERQHGSNCTFIGLNDAVVPEYFSRVSAPLCLDPLFSRFFGAFASSDLIAALKDPYTDFSYFMIDDISLEADSSLFVEDIPNLGYFVYAWDFSNDRYILFKSGRGTPPEFYPFRRRLYGHIGVEPILGSATKEYVETIDGRHIIVENTIGQVSGGEASEFGYNSNRDTFLVFSEYDPGFIMENGKTYNCNGWFKFTVTSALTIINQNSLFFKYLVDAGMADPISKEITFIDPSERYSIFMPSDAALTAAKVDTLSVPELKDFLQFHIVRDEFIFTDGRQDRGNYTTYNGEKLELDPIVDEIRILNGNGGLYLSVPYSSKANLIATHLKDASENYFSSNAVFHKIDTVIHPY